jgi:hypothetical protein
MGCAGLECSIRLACPTTKRASGMQPSGRAPDRPSPLDRVSLPERAPIHSLGGATVGGPLFGGETPNAVRAAPY